MRRVSIRGSSKALYSWIMVMAIVSIADATPADRVHQNALVGVDHRVLATSKTSTMEKEMNDAAEAGFHLGAVMGGETAFGGKEVVVIMSRGDASKRRYGYRLLATSKTSTMQKELQEAADQGFHYHGQTVFQSAFAGDEVVVILERDNDDLAKSFDYKLVATSKTSTLQKELTEAGMAGYEVVGMTVGKTAMGGAEVVAITRRARAH